MIQQQSYLDIADNTGAKQAMCIKVLGGSSSKGKFKRKVADNPPAGQDDAGVKKTISGAYQAGLQNVKKLAESK